MGTTQRGTPLVVWLFGAAVIAAACGGPSIVPLNTKPTDVTQAENLGYSVAIKAGCGNFESLDARGQQGEWHFTCQIADTSYDIVVFGSDEARDAGIAVLKNGNRPLVTAGYYAVAVCPSGPSKSAAMEASISPSLLIPFK